MLQPIVWNVDPEFINLFDRYSVRYYSILFGLGIYLSGWLTYQHLKKSKHSQISFEHLSIYIIMGIVIGARLGHCLFYDPTYYLANPIEMLLPIQKIEGAWTFTGYLGLASHGGSIGVLLALYLFSKRKKIQFLQLLDIVALATPLAGAFIRLGNFMNSEIIGQPTNGNYGIIFEQVDQLPRHPSQLYEAITYFIIFILLYANKRQLFQYTGRYFGIMVMLVFIARFAIEFTKIDQASFEAGMLLNMGQLLSIPFILIGAYFTFRKVYLAP